MPDDLTRFLIRFEGGPRDGSTSGSVFVEPEELPSLLDVDGEIYALEMRSQLPPTRGIVRGAQYRYVGPASVPESS